MKRIYLFTCLLCLPLYAASQSEMVNFIIEHNVTENGQYIYYQTPLRINQVSSSAQIDYAKPEGLIQSFYSADNLEWALSDYLDKPSFMVRDQEHFDAVKKRGWVKNYAQLESIYSFNHNSKDFCFAKYSIIVEQLPFAIVTLMVMEKSNGRWHISKILNQNQVTSLLTNLESSVLKKLFTNTNSDVLPTGYNPYLNNGNFSFAKMAKVYVDLREDKKSTIFNTLRDTKLIGEGNKGKDAILMSQPTSLIVTIEHPYLLDSTYYLEYPIDSNTIDSNPENIEKWESKIESKLFSENKVIKLDKKLSFYRQGNQYDIISFSAGLKNVAVFKNGVSTENLQEFQKLGKFISQLRSGILPKLIDVETENKDLARIRKASSSSDDVLNLGLLIDYLEANPSERKFVFDN